MVDHYCLSHPAGQILEFRCPHVCFRDGGCEVGPLTLCAPSWQRFLRTLGEMSSPWTESSGTWPLKHHLPRLPQLLWYSPHSLSFSVQVRIPGSHGWSSSHGSQLSFVGSVLFLPPILLSYSLFSLFWHRVSLWSHGCPRTHSVEQRELKLAVICLSLSPECWN